LYRNNNLIRGQPDPIDIDAPEGKFFRVRGGKPVRNRRCAGAPDQGKPARRRGTPIVGTPGRNPVHNIAASDPSAALIRMRQECRRSDRPAPCCNRKDVIR